MSTGSGGMVAGTVTGRERNGEGEGENRKKKSRRKGDISSIRDTQRN